MNILVVHNSYQQRGGEDAVVVAESRLLEARGHSVLRYERHNNELRGQGMLAAIASGIEAVWAAKSYREIKALLAKEKPDLAHFHNTLPLISPAAYYACEEAGVPVVQTLHNYRLLCPAATFLRCGKVCESCLGRSIALPGIVRACYRGSRSATLAVAAMSAAHRALGTWTTKVNVYIALSQFARSKFIEGGLPAERIIVKPNFVYPDPGRKNGPGEYALYVGRLSEEKGLRVLLDAWSRLEHPIPLRIIGQGPMRETLASEINDKRFRNIELLGGVLPGKVPALMQSACFLVSPSLCFENFPLAIAEAFACGLPVIASRLGSLTEIVNDGTNGLLFEAGSAADLAFKVAWAWNHPEALARLSVAARSAYEVKYQSSLNYELLVGIYHRAIASPPPDALPHTTPAGSWES